jgi:hypothetical protein
LYSVQNKNIDCPKLILWAKKEITWEKKFSAQNKEEYARQKNYKCSVKYMQNISFRAQSIWKRI